MEVDILFGRNEPFFAGHFPGHPVVPGVMLLDRAVKEASKMAGDGFVLGSAEKVKFAGPVFPGDEVALSLERRSAGAFGYAFRKNGAVCASGTLCFVRKGATMV